MADNRSCATFEEYWESIHLPGPDSPLFKPYVAAYDAAKRAFEAGIKAERRRAFERTNRLNRAVLFDDDTHLKGNNA